jgi:hypothetical protein
MRALFLLLATTLFSGQICYFVPPEKWEIAQPKDQTGYLQVGFVNTSYSSYLPRVSLATEDDAGTSVKEYVKQVKELQKTDPSIKEWRDLGPLKMQGGMGRLIEMQSSCALGDIKIMQAILLKNQTAYILTASALKKDFPSVQSQVLKTFQSLTLIPDLTAPIKDRVKKEELKEIFASLGKSSKEAKSELQKLQKSLKPYSDLGAYWEFLALREGAAKIQSGK